MIMMTNAKWRDSARNPRFFIMDAAAIFPLVLFLLHISLWTFVLAIISMFFLMVLERFQFTIPVFMRWLRSFLAGNQRIAYPWWRE